MVGATIPLHEFPAPSNVGHPPRKEPMIQIIQLQTSPPESPQQYYRISWKERIRLRLGGGGTEPGDESRQNVATTGEDAHNDTITRHAYDVVEGVPKPEVSKLGNGEGIKGLDLMLLGNHQSIPPASDDTDMQHQQFQDQTCNSGMVITSQRAQSLSVTDCGLPTSRGTATATTPDRRGLFWAITPGVKGPAPANPPESRLRSLLPRFGFVFGIFIAGVITLARVVRPLR
ncbi:hypothetical protein M407DRAFT_24946 [Tulasnella calospora MUT 4182]|uniref:Uncharacterized protein n=1 Tax=Tulasnella calospora MUT 4182 TaxID=1051891 RepID=A0A0C3KW25_9AGAM|nr:hypothetical protein M407DRAFT_24946 [Tulasnella calospora MUT 4182]